MVFLGMGLEESWRSHLSSVSGARRFYLLTGKCISMECFSSTSPMHQAGVLRCIWDTSALMDFHSSIPVSIQLEQRDEQMFIGPCFEPGAIEYWKFSFSLE